MADLHTHLIAALTGFAFGFILQVPVGPINLTIMNEGARRGFLWAAMIGAGATVMEIIYCGLAFTGFAALFQGHVIKGIMEFASVFFFLYLGIKFVRVKKIAELDKKEPHFLEKHPHSAFMTGLVRVAGNLGVFLFWIVLAARFHDRGWVEPNLSGTISCLIGVAIGTALWFGGLAFAVSRGHGKFTDKTLLRMEHISGIFLLCLAGAEALHMVWQWHKHTL